MVGVSVTCSSNELVPSVDLLYSGGYKWWGVSVTFSCVELVPSVIRPTVQLWIQMVGCQYRLFLNRAGAKCNRIYCTVVDTDGGRSVSPVPLMRWCRV